MGRESFYVLQNTMRGIRSFMRVALGVKSIEEIIELDISSDMILDGLGFMDKK